MKPAAEKAANNQKALVWNAWRTVKLDSTVEAGASTLASTESFGSARLSFGAGSGSNPRSSGRRAMNRIGGITPMTKVNRPIATQAVRQSQPVIMNWAAKGMTASPAPLAPASTASARGRRRINQLLIDVGIPNSMGPEKIIRPGTYMA